MIKPIETEYNGFRFRSRLEARWAVFFDSARIKYIYEHEGYLLDNGVKYLPDFYLPDFDCHVEVKADTPEGRQEILNKCFPAIQWGGPIKKILVLSDVPEGRSVDGGLWHFPIVYWSEDRSIWGWWFFWDTDYQPTPVCGNISGAGYRTLPYNQTSMENSSIKAVSDEVLKNTRMNYYPRFLESSKEQEIVFQNTANKVTFSCYAKARQARFEHGEKPEEVPSHD